MQVLLSGAGLGRNLLGSREKMGRIGGNAFLATGFTLGAKFVTKGCDKGCDQREASHQ